MEWKSCFFGVDYFLEIGGAVYKETTNAWTENVGVS